MKTPPSEKTHHPKPIIKKLRWPTFVIWLIPLLAAAFAGYLLYDTLHNRGPQITLRFTDATGLKPNESKLVHLGIQIGQVTSLELSPDQKQALVHVRLTRAASSYANQGAVFWIVRPEISTQEISGLATVLSGPIIDALSGSGPPQSEFIGLEKKPLPTQDGITVLLKTPRLEHLHADSPIYYRGFQVGTVKDVTLADDAASADIHAFIQRRFAPLVKSNSQFWITPAVDLKGGIFTGLQMKVESIPSLFFGGITFATPEDDAGPPAQNNSTFTLNDEPKKEWLTWTPKIPLAPEDTDEDTKLPHPHTPRSIRSSVAPN